MHSSALHTCVHADLVVVLALNHCTCPCTRAHVHAHVTRTHAHITYTHAPTRTHTSRRYLSQETFDLLEWSFTVMNMTKPPTVCIVGTIRELAIRGMLEAENIKNMCAIDLF